MESKAERDGRRHERGRVKWKRSGYGIGIVCKVRREAIETDFEDTGLPRVAVEHVDCSARVLRSSKDDGAISPRAVVWAEGHISAEDSARFAEKILEVLPLTVKRQLINKRVRS